MFNNILTNTQVELLGLIKEFNKQFYLVGGTAIALQIGHRRSIDFDLFSDKPLDTLNIIRRIKREGYRIDATFEENPEELTMVINGVKITYLEYPFNIIPSVGLDDTIKMPDLKTLAAMKAYSLGRRSKWKDYVDLYFIFKSYLNLEEVSQKAREIFGGGFNERLFREQLCYFEDIDFSEGIEYVVDEVSIEVIKNFLINISLLMP